MDLDENLIHLVQKYDCLYNVKAKNYSDRNSKNNAWTKVSEEINLSVGECQKKWKKIRDCYRKAMKLRQTSSSGSARTNTKPVKYEKELEFLKPYVNNQSQTSNLDSPEEIEENFTDTDSLSAISPPSPRPASQLSNSSRNEPLKMSQILYRDYIEAKKNEDPTDSFFLTMSRKVKKMPKKIQAEIERDIFRLVNEAEIKLAEAMQSSAEEITLTPSRTYIPSNAYPMQSTTEERTHTPPRTYIPSNTYPIQSTTEERTHTPPRTYIPSNTYPIQSTTEERTHTPPRTYIPSNTYPIQSTTEERTHTPPRTYIPSNTYPIQSTTEERTHTPPRTYIPSNTYPIQSTTEERTHTPPRTYIPSNTYPIQSTTEERTHTPPRTYIPSNTYTSSSNTITSDSGFPNDPPPSPYVPAPLSSIQKQLIDYDVSSMETYLRDADA